MMRTIFRRSAQTLGAVTISYGVYTASVQYWAGLEISRRSRADLPVEQRYAPIQVLGRYVNPFEEYRHQTLFEFGFRRISELFALNPAGDVPVDPKVLKQVLPVYDPDFRAYNRHFPWTKDLPDWLIQLTNKFSPKTRLALTWFGQSCALAQLPGNVSLLTDPMFSDYVVSERVGPQRLVSAPVQPQQIPQPQAILVSHDHQDHLDLAATKQLTKPGTTWVVPEGVKKHLPANAEVVEMTWWQRIPFPNVDPRLGYEIACTPAMHWSGRALYDSNTTLWCSFLVLRNGKPLFFHGGDSGYSPVMYKAIESVYGPGCGLAMMPCGAYLPRWHLRAQHMAPHESIATMKDLKAQHLVGVHWGTFVMSEEPFMEPPKKLVALAKEDGLANVFAPCLGRTMVFDVES